VISPFYFRAVMGWWWRPDVRLATVLQGALEGSVTGLVFGLFTATVVASVTRLRCPPRAIIGVPLVALMIAFACWVLGGLVSAAFAANSPQGFLHLVPIAPRDRHNLVPFAWVGGSIWGAYTGSVLAMAYAVVAVQRRWRTIKGARQAFDVVQPVVTLSAGG
jgi:hypothetical protein